MSSELYEFTDAPKALLIQGKTGLKVKIPRFKYWEKLSVVLTFNAQLLGESEATTGWPFGSSSSSGYLRNDFNVLTSEADHFMAGVCSQDFKPGDPFDNREVFLGAGPRSSGGSEPPNSDPTKRVIQLYAHGNPANKGDFYSFNTNFELSALPVTENLKLIQFEFIPIKTFADGIYTVELAVRARPYSGVLTISDVTNDSIDALFDETVGFIPNLGYYTGYKIKLSESTDGYDLSKFPSHFYLQCPKACAQLSIFNLGFKIHDGYNI